MPLYARIIVAFATLFVFTMQMAGGVNSDVSWLLTAGERMLAGQQLYVDIFELNPPMSAFLYLPFVALAHALAITPEVVVVAATLFLVLASLRFSINLLLRHFELVNPTLWWLISYLALTVSLGHDFAQREHIAVILILPVIAVSALRSAGKSPNVFAIIVAGLAAGLVMSIKPHFALPVLLIGLWSAFERRSWLLIITPEHVLAGAILAAYWIAFWTWFPAFFSNMVPLASAAYLPDRWPLQLLLLGPALWLFWPMAIGLLLVYRREAFVRPNGQYLAAAAGFLLVYFAQGKGFVYHALPAQILVSIVLAQCFAARDAHGKAAGIHLILAMALVAVPGLSGLRGDSLREEIKAVLVPLGPGLKFANLTGDLAITSPLHRDLQGTLINSGPSLWITRGAVRLSFANDEAAFQLKLAELKDYERQLFAADMLANPPDIILVSGEQFDWLAWATEDPRIAAMLENYKVLAKVGLSAAPLQILERKQF